MRYAVFLAGLLIALPADAEVWSCTADYSSTFDLEDKATGTWVPAVVNSEPVAEFDIRRSPREFKSKWIVTRVDIVDHVAVCDKDFNKAGFLFCTGLMEFRFNKKSLKFSAASILTFVTLGSEMDTDLGPAFLVLGRCTAKP